MNAQHADNRVQYERSRRVACQEHFGSEVRAVRLS